MVFPVNNLPSNAQPWTREVQKRVENIEATAVTNEVNNIARDAQLSASYKRLDNTVTQLAVTTAAATTAAQQANDAILGLGNLDQSTSTYKINADNLTAGTINANTINITNINANNITSGSISADRIDAGTIDSSSINITSGSYSLNVGNTGMAAYLNVSPSSSNGVSLNRVGFVSISTAGWWSNMYPYLNNDVYCGLAAYAWAGIRSVTAVVVTSDERTKNSITDSDLGLDFIESLRPVSYKFNVGRNETTFDENGEINGSVEHPGRRKHYGLVAQEVKQSLDQFNIDDFGGWVLDDINDPDSPQALRYEEFISPLIKAVQELSARVRELEGA
jgi:outer membrane murein-binding lipoprotein Lpp